MTIVHNGKDWTQTPPFDTNYVNLSCTTDDFQRRRRFVVVVLQLWRIGLQVRNVRPIPEFTDISAAKILIVCSHYRPLRAFVFL